MFNLKDIVMIKSGRYEGQIGEIVYIHPHLCLENQYDIDLSNNTRIYCFPETEICRIPMDDIKNYKINYMTGHKTYEQIIREVKNNIMKEYLLDGTELSPFCLNSIAWSLTTPPIIDVNPIVPDKVVEVTFADETKEKAVCKEPDVFSMDAAISVCVAKKAMGGSSAYNKAVKQGLKVYNDKLAQEAAAEEEQKRLERKREKREAYKARRLMRRKAKEILKEQGEKEKQIEIQKEAYIRAMEYMKTKYGEASVKAPVIMPEDPTRVTSKKRGAYD